MNKLTHHEEIYRGKEALKKIKNHRIMVVGCGALGSNLLDSLARQGYTALGTLDFDRVEEHNIGTQRFTQQDVGKLKVEAMDEHIYSTTKISLAPEKAILNATNGPKLFRGYQLVVDCLDNSASRSYVQDHARSTNVPTLHAGLSADYGEVIWDEDYLIPKDAPGDVCDYPLARNIVMLTVTIMSEVINDFVVNSKKRNFCITLRDMKISQLAHKS